MCSRNFNAPGSPFYEAGGDGPTSSSNKYRSEDIMSCISALDEVIAEFDDPSLSYIYEDDCSAPGTPSQSQIVPSSSGETTKYFSGEDQLVLKNEKANHATPHKVVNQPVSESNSNSNSKSSPPSRQSHLIQIPVFSSTKSSKVSNSKSSKSEGTGVSSIQPISKEKVISPSSSSTSTPSSLSSKLPGRPSVVPQTCSDTSPNLKVSKSGSSNSGGGGGACGGTYSKGTMSSQEILLLPRIPSCSSDNKSSVGSSSSRKHVQQEPIYSSVGKSRPQLSLGMYTSSEPDAGGHHHRHLFPPQEPEVDYNDETTHDVTKTRSDAAAAGLYNANNDHNHHEKPFSSSGGSGRLSKSSSSSGAAAAMGCLASSPSTQPTKELWNFPSEKNLPRSLRKTRNTCFLDDNSMGEKSEGKLNNESDSEARSIGGHSSASEELHPSSRHHQHNNNGRNSTKMDDKQKIYEEIAEIISSNKGQQHKGAAVDSFERASSSSSNSFTFNSFNNNSTSPGADPQLANAPMPKPRVRQQIPKEDGLSPVKYPPPPGKIPKPNPKPVAGTNQTEPSSPFSPLQCEITRTGDEVVVDVSKAGIFHETTNEMKHSVKNSRLKNNNLNNGSSPTTTTTTPTPTATQNHNNGNMMRMMMMNPSSKNNSTGSASSISRSSSSSSGGDPNYYRKDNLSSSSGVVVTTNSSITTGSPTHSVNNNSLTLNNNNNNTNNNVTIIHSEKCGSEGGSSVSMMVKATPQNKQQVHNQRGAGQQQQRGHPGIGKQASSTPVGACHQVKHITAKPTTTVVLTNGVLEVDDGYLSMINRNEAPLLWPEEFIENETFSPDELKRLSVHLPEEDEDEDSSTPDSDSCSEEKEIELEIVDYDREPSRRQPNHNPSLKSSAGGGSKARRQMSEKKTDYFSDDSLEGDREEDLANFHHKKARGKSSSVSPYLYHGDGGGYHNAGNLHSTNSTPSHRPYYRQQITVNTAATPMVRGQVSRIPKMISGTKPNKGGGKGSSPDTQVKLPKRKPCSFFVSLTDEGCSEVNSPITNNKSSSLPMGAKVAVSPIKSSAAKVNQSATATPSSSNVQIIDSKSTTAETNNNSNRGGEGFTNTTTAPQVMVNSNLPHLRYTKSINTGGPRHFSSNVNNANKRKSTSDLVTVVALNNNHDATDIPPTHNTNPPTSTATVNTGGSVNSTSMFNRTSTFLIPSPISRTGHDELNANQLKRPRDDETDNDEDDFSSDFDILSSTDPEPLDSLQPLSLTDVNDFVSEIMDTALRQEIKRTQMVLNNYPPTDIDSSTNSQLIADKSQQAVQEQPPLEHHQRNATQQPSSLSPQQGKRKSSSLPAVAAKKEEATLCCDNDDQPAVENLPEDREERARVALQLEAVVSTFLSDNQSFLGRGESEDGDLDVDVQHAVAGGRNECDDKNSSKGEVVKISHLKPNHGESLDHFNDKKDEGQKVEDMSKTDITVCSDVPPIEKDFLPKGTLQPQMNSIGGGGGCGSSNNSAIRDSSLVGEEKILDVEESDEEEEDSAEEQPPEFIPTPPPHLLSPPPIPIAPMVVSTIPQHKNLQPGFINTNGNLHNLHNSNVRDGKAALDILAERINNSKKFSNPDDQVQVSQFIHDKRNIWAMYDRPFDEDLLTVNNPGVRGYASRSQENLMDAMTKERFQKSFNSRGQSSTLPLNCRPPSSGGQRRSSTFRNMFSKFRRNKQPSGQQVIKELPEYRDDEVQSITSRETGPSEQGKKRGFFSRLFRRSRKH